MPRKGYKTITVKTEAFENFVNGITKAKKKDPLIENSEFLDLLLAKYTKEKKN